MDQELCYVSIIWIVSFSTNNNFKIKTTVTSIFPGKEIKFKKYFYNLFDNINTKKEWRNGRNYNSAKFLYNIEIKLVLIQTRILEFNTVILELIC